MPDYSWTCNGCGMNNPPYTERCRECGAEPFIENAEAQSGSTLSRSQRLQAWIGSLPPSSRLAVVTLIGEVFWFLMLFPLLPKTTTGWLFSLGIGAIFGPCVLLLGWLQRQSNNQFAWRALGVVVAVSVGSGILWFFVGEQSFIQQNLSYFGR